MAMRPFYRSRLLWLGVPGLVFLLWVWWDSGKWDTFVFRTRDGFMEEVRVSRGQVEWERSAYTNPEIRQVFRDSFPGVFDSGRSKHRGDFGWADRGEMDLLSKQREGGFDLRKGVDWETGCVVKGGMAGPVEVQGFRLALWVVVLGYVMVWLGAVVWWQRRKARVVGCDVLSNR